MDQTSSNSDVNVCSFSNKCSTMTFRLSQPTSSKPLLKAKTRLVWAVRSTSNPTPFGHELPHVLSRRTRRKVCQPRAEHSVLKALLKAIQIQIHVLQEGMENHRLNLKAHKAMLKRCSTASSLLGCAIWTFHMPLFSKLNGGTGLGTRQLSESD